MNKKAQNGPIAGILLFMVFIILYFVWLGGWLAEMGQLIIMTNNYTGFEAFFYSNLNVVVFLCLLLGIMAFLYFGGRE